MSHPLIPHILDLARPVADQLNLDVVNVALQTNQHPPILRLDVRNRSTDTGLEDCEQMSRMFEAVLDGSDLMLDAYVLEVSSPGLSPELTTDQDFTSFKGFPVMVRTTSPYRGQREWAGTLIGRDNQNVHLNQKGRNTTIPRNLISQVQLQDSS